MLKDRLDKKSIGYLCKSRSNTGDMLRTLLPFPFPFPSPSSLSPSFSTGSSPFDAANHVTLTFPSLAVPSTPSPVSPFPPFLLSLFFSCQFSLTYSPYLLLLFFLTFANYPPFPFSLALSFSLPLPFTYPLSFSLLHPSLP